MKFLLALAGAVALVAVALFSAPTTNSASAAPVGAASGLSFGSQVCHSNGTVSGTLKWAPSGLGSQHVDLATDSAFKSRSTGGPFASNANSVSFTQLQKGKTYYARVRTAAASGTLTSDTLAFSATCPAPASITKPVNLAAYVLSNDTVRFDWTAGQNNQRYCLDVALSLSDLYDLKNSWRNYGCWTTNSEWTVAGLSCDTTYYWLVFAWNDSASIKSDAAVVKTAPCAPSITPPTNLTATRLSDGGVLFDWDAGTSNRWYCLDTAKSAGDLVNLVNSWRNHGCWTTNSQLVVYGLDCDTTYYWSVFAWNDSSSVKSSMSTVNTHTCKAESHLEKAPIEAVDVVKVSGSYRAQIIAALPDSCHKHESYRVDRYGNTIRITVVNRVVEGMCAFVYSTYQLNVNLGTDFTPGQTYEVIVNEAKSDTFVAN